MQRHRSLLVALTLTSLALGATSASALAQDGGLDAVAQEAIDGTVADPAAKAAPNPGASPAKPARIGLRVRGLKGGKLKAGDKVTVNGTLRPFAKGERVTLLLKRGNKTVRRKTMYAQQKKGKSFGKFKIADKIAKSGRYSVQAIKKPSPNLRAAKDRTRTFKIRYPDLNPGNRNSYVGLLNRLLAKQGYATDKGKHYGGATERAVLAFRKVNRMSRITNISSSNLKKLANGKGGYKAKYPGSGKHVEVDVTRQVMALLKGDKVIKTYHVSTGSSATPTPSGTWRFYRKEPGYNSLRMYYSVYYNRGYATHGFHDVPTYPASHGCTRNPESDSKYIYNWIDIGDLINVYR